MRKSEAALVLAAQVGQRFDAIVTSSEAVTWVRLFAPPAQVANAGGCQASVKVEGRARR